MNPRGFRAADASQLVLIGLPPPAPARHSPSQASLPALPTPPPSIRTPLSPHPHHHHPATIQPHLLNVLPQPPPPLPRPPLSPPPSPPATPAPPASLPTTPVSQPYPLPPAHTSSMSFRSRAMRPLSRRRSTSICFSPIPLTRPLPPRWRSRCVHMRVRRGSWYSLCASSTCDARYGLWRLVVGVGESRVFGEGLESVWGGFGGARGLAAEPPHGPSPSPPAAPHAIQLYRV